jgi:hypothetical protein
MKPEQTKKVLRTYENLLTKKGFESKRIPSTDIPINEVKYNKEILNHICWMCAEAQRFDENKLDKINRWLGFIQGTLWTSGLFTIDDMREHVIEASKKER